MPCQSPGLVDGVERDNIVCIRDVLVLSTPTHEEDSVQRRSPKTYSWRRKTAHLSPLSLGAIFHHLCKKISRMEHLTTFNTFVTARTSVLDKETPPNSPPVTISICNFQNVSTPYVRTELTHLAYTRAVFTTGVLISEVGKMHSQFIDQRTSLPILLERS